MIPDLVIIPVTHAIPAVQDVMGRPWEQRELTDDEVGALSALLTRCVYASEVLVTYAQALGGKPSSN